jgi:hypothetical protein
MGPAVDALVCGQALPALPTPGAMPKPVYGEKRHFLAA